MNYRRRVDRIVQNDGHALFHVFGGDTLKQLGSRVVEVNRDIRVLKFADRDARVRQHIACEYRTFLHQVRRFCHAPAFFVDGAFEENFVIRRYFRAEALEDLLFFPSGHAARQVFRKRTVLVQHFELEKSGVLDKRLGPARILDAR